jgi:hypothetical protein
MRCVFFVFVKNESLALKKKENSLLKRENVKMSEIKDVVLPKSEREPTAAPPPLLSTSLLNKLPNDILIDIILTAGPSMYGVLSQSSKPLAEAFAEAWVSACRQTDLSMPASKAPLCSAHPLFPCCLPTVLNTEEDFRKAWKLLAEAAVASGARYKIGIRFFAPIETKEAALYRKPQTKTVYELDMESKQYRKVEKWQIKMFMESEKVLQSKTGVLFVEDAAWLDARQADDEEYFQTQLWNRYKEKRLTHLQLVHRESLGPTFRPIFVNYAYAAAEFEPPPSHVTELKTELKTESPKKAKQESMTVFRLTEFGLHQPWNYLHEQICLPSADDVQVVYDVQNQLWGVSGFPAGGETFAYLIEAATRYHKPKIRAALQAWVLELLQKFHSQSANLSILPNFAGLSDRDFIARL